ncbi:MAG: T9SS type A sorting domain-containing protein [Ignavibacteria bacterium]|nr:T9SS type A sorting domain-containing protein [Ignavibacteria bacterium]
MIKIFLTLFMLTLGVAISKADTLYVHPVAELGNDGQSWETPLRTIAIALDKATAGDEIWVARGSYLITETFQLKIGVKIFGGFYGLENVREKRDWFRHPVNLIASNLGVIVQATNCDTTAQLDGFYLKGATQHALVINGGTARIYNCHFTENTGEFGAAVIADGADRVKFEYCVFSKNSTTGAGGAVSVKNGVDPQKYGWGIYFGQCGFLNNVSATTGGAIAIDGVVGIPQISSCVFFGNSAGTTGGAIDTRNAFVYVTNTTFSMNTVSSGTGRTAAMNGGHIQNSIMWNGVEEDTTKHVAMNLNSGDTSMLTSTANLIERDFDLGFYQNDPQFTNQSDPFGADGYFGTDDDGLVLALGSTGIDAGVIDRFVNHHKTDVIGSARLVFRKIDLGAYETQRVGHDQYQAIMEEVRTGKLVLLFRHMKTDWDSKDKGPAPECFPGRNLILEGRDQAASVGKHMRSLGIQIGDVPSSPVCRCWESNSKMHGKYEVKSHWANSGGAANEALRAADISTMPTNGVRSIVTHDAVIVPLMTDTNVTTAEVMEGDAIIIRPLGDNFIVIGHFCSDTWERYHLRFSDIPAGVQENKSAFEMLKAHVSPNPVNDNTFSINVASTVNGENEIRITGTDGRQIITRANFVYGVATSELSQLAAGVYALSVNVGGTNYRTTFCKAP